MSAHVLSNLLNELRKRDKMRGLSSILSLFRNEFDKFNNYGSTDVRFFLSFDIKIVLKSYCSLQMLGVCHMRDVQSVISSIFPKICKPLVTCRIYRF